MSQAVAVVGEAGKVKEGSRCGLTEVMIGYIFSSDTAVLCPFYFDINLENCTISLHPIYHKITSHHINIKTFITPTSALPIPPTSTNHSKCSP